MDLKRSDFERKTFVMWTATCPKCKVLIVQDENPARLDGIQCHRCGMWFDFDKEVDH